MTKPPTALQGVAKTALIALAARAWDAESPSPILGDKNAAEVVKSLPFDLDDVYLPAADIQGVAIRSLQFDKWVVDFLERHPDALVLHLACGLDGRAERVGWRGEGQSIWVDVDLPAVVELREEYMPREQKRKHYRCLAADALENNWLTQLPKDKPTAIIMEGLLAYLPAQDVRTLLTRLANHFSHGEMFFECMTTLVLRAAQQSSSLDVQRKTGATLQSSMDDLSSLETIGNETRVEEVLRFVELPGVEKLGWVRRVQMYVASWILGARDGSRLVRLRFGSASGWAG